MNRPNHKLLLASRNARLSGALLDIVILVPPALLILFLTGVWEVNTSANEGFSIIEDMIGFAVCFLLFFACNGYLLVKQGQTINKRIVGTRIVTIEGAVPSGTSLVFLRYLIPQAIGIVPVAGWLFMSANCFFVFRQDHRCLHDHIAGTFVVDAK